ncbi:MAG TPA: OsmC family peroxiredoxin [Candidatus Caldiarchaeum subterraneum]|uniref:OsmC family peroxiredoxin n=1 Tax=Caldiarchaeum subterraneum TaxID=311458 RepID=A0A833EAT7_CALS0|nr:OsmC family peroxiredoxin [Aigarchaeota archaeon]HIQ30000.1 OsmC family peroxiredoxin [Candidatus Caldarchaeum subterraneum]
MAELNGLDLGKLEEVVKLVSENRDKAEELNRWKARVRWLGGFKARAYVRDHTFFIDEPSDLAGVDTAPNAVEYVLSALGACLTVGFILNATKNGVKIEDFEIALEGKINNILTFLGLSREGHPGYEEITARFYVKSDAEPEVIKKIVDETVATSPVGNTLTRNVKINPSISVLG